MEQDYRNESQVRRLYHLPVTASPSFASQVEGGQAQCCTATMSMLMEMATESVCSSSDVRPDGESSQMTGISLVDAVAAALEKTKRA
ncbi:hypothetical protein KXD40_009158 [Peronospora effusa]|uniref:Uncharacterized protein n=1 Tax=Peronospora effusa TaxID=542832 RepID=A0A3M6VNJ5_9STRA|nr:hypothetical protein DD238_005531 [Peronospora effusa]RQM10808.1 hypothetical protein DD237_006918 [Peronospora effusa]UIZ25369.1 hypothetical protein KXD40_009158 [Peronospora effusa]